MSLFANLNNDNLEKTEDRLGGGFKPLNTGAYDFVIKLAYADKSSKGAQFIHLQLETADGRSKLQKDVYITNQKGENFFLNKQDNTKKVPLPGFTIIDDICLATTEEPLCKQATEEKSVKIWNSTERKEVPTARHVLVDLMDKPVTLGIVNQLVDVTKKDESTGDYVPTGESKNENDIAKVFHTGTKLTMVEARESLPAEFYNKWVEANPADKVVDKRAAAKGGAGAPAKNSAPPQAGSAAAAPRKKLFG